VGILPAPIEPLKIVIQDNLGILKRGR
jgi:hypothetical protein